MTDSKKLIITTNKTALSTPTPKGKPTLRLRSLRKLRSSTDAGAFIFLAREQS